MKRNHTLITMLLGLILATALISGCHTVSGAGQDISAGGHAITKAANNA